MQNQPHDTITKWRCHADNTECHLVDLKRSKNHSLKLCRIYRSPGFFKREALILYLLLWSTDEMDSADAVSGPQTHAGPRPSAAATGPPSTDHHKGDGDHLDNLDQMLDHSLEMNKEMEADVDSLLSQELAQIDSKTVEDIFKGVLEQGPAPSPTTGKGCRAKCLVTRLETGLKQAGNSWEQEPTMASQCIPVVVSCLIHYRLIIIYTQCHATKNIDRSCVYQNHTTDWVRVSSESHRTYK